MFSPEDNAIPVLMRRGVVFTSCHNAIWEEAGGLIAKGVNPDKLSHEALAAELTNHLIPGVILTPGAVGTLPELQQAGFTTRSEEGSMHRFRKAMLAGCAVALALSSAARAEDAKGPPGPFPPWQHGDNNDATPRGLPFTVPEVDVLADFHGSLDDPKLVLFVGGNYFFAMAPLVRRSRRATRSTRVGSFGRRSRRACSSSRSRRAVPSRSAT